MEWWSGYLYWELMNWINYCIHGNNSCANQKEENNNKIILPPQQFWNSSTYSLLVSGLRPSSSALNSIFTILNLDFWGIFTSSVRNFRHLQLTHFLIQFSIHRKLVEPKTYSHCVLSMHSSQVVYYLQKQYGLDLCWGHA